MMQVMRFHLARHTRRFDVMLRFYRDQLGFTVIESWNETHSRGALMSPFPEAGHTSIEVIQMGEIAMPNPDPPVNTAVTMEVDDVQVWHDRLAAAGVTIARGIEDAEWGHRSFGVDDPDGMRLWFYQDMNP
jgi:uncharacterized glyoxalase superfamily protein PhnB